MLDFSLAFLAAAFSAFTYADGDDSVMNLTLFYPWRSSSSSVHIYIYTHYCLFAERALFMYVHALALLQLPPLVTRKVS
jgi:hypothetical protein